MLSTNLTTQFGKIFANILREFVRFDGIIGRDTTHIRNSCMKCCANNDTVDQTFSKCNLRTSISSLFSANAANTNMNINMNNNVQLMAEKQKNFKKPSNIENCPNGGKLETSLPSSSFKLAKVWRTSSDQSILDQEFEPERTLNDDIKAHKRNLNATNAKLTLTSTTSTASNSALIPIQRIVNTISSTPKKSFLRSMSMLAHKPMTISLIKIDGSSFNVTKRCMSPKINYRNECAEWCGEDVCNLNRKTTHLKKSMWLTPPCFNQCEKPYRYDIVFMPGSNKETREYQQTWIECPPIRPVKKPICCYEPKCLPPICRRPRKERKPLPAKYETCGINLCRDDIHHPDCIKIREPCCTVKAREMPCCKVYPTPACCQKRCTPYPSFSECCKPEMNRKGPVECLCLVRPTMCEVWTDWRRKYLPGQYEDL